jgi:hypothetical protein
MSTGINIAGQAKLVSGTNIKTVNSTTLLGSGDLAVQPTLVSGTNIKTINSTSLLGSGDLVVGGGGTGIHVITKPYSGMGICLNVTTATNTSTFSLPSNILNLYPFIPANNVTINQIVFEVSSAATTGGTARVTIYSDLNGKPSSRIFQSASVATTTTGYKTITTTQSFTAGTTYWIGLCTSANFGAVRSTAATDTYAISYTNSNGTQFTQNFWSYTVTTAPGSEPTTLTTGSLSANFDSIPNFNLRVA